MTWRSDDGHDKVQRLSTPSYVECRDISDATRWLWYWQEKSEGKKWITYKVFKFKRNGLAVNDADIVIIGEGGCSTIHVSEPH